MSDRWWTITPLVLAGAALVLLFALVPHTVSGDGYARFQKVEALLHDGTLRPEPYSLVGPLFASPLWAFGGARLWWVARFNVLVLSAGIVACWFLLRTATSTSDRAAIALLLATAGTPPNATLDFYGETFSAVTVVTGLLLVYLHDRPAGWVPVVLGVVNMPASAAGLLLVAIHRAWSARRFDGVVAVVTAAAMILLENTIVRGGPLASGYAGNHGVTTMMPFSGLPGFSYPLLLGVASLLLSFGKGLLLFAPAVLLLPSARRQRPQLVPFIDASIAFLVGLVLVYARWWAWYGGWTWGPRYLLFAAFPASIALALALNAPGAARRSALILGVAVWSVWVGVSGIVFNLSGLDDCLANGYALEHLCWYVPEYSPLLRPFALPTPTLAGWQWAWLAVAAAAMAVLITSGPSLETIGSAIARGVRARMARR